MSGADSQPRLTERQERILELVVDAYLESPDPVSSRAIAARPEAALFQQESEIESSCGIIKDTCCYFETSCRVTEKDHLQ